MPRLAIYSDLHLEFADFEPPKLDVDAVILAGDIHVGIEAIRWIRAHFADRPVIYVAGNHEYYRHNLPRLNQKIAALCKDSNIHFLECDNRVVAGVRFLGATLWTDYAITGDAELAMFEGEQMMTDFRLIRHGDKHQRLRAEHLLRRHARTRAWLRQHLDGPFDGPTVVVTHHAPSMKSVHPKFLRADPHINASYASDLESLLGGTCALWVHGHMHDSFDYEITGTRVICNPRGYLPDEGNPAFQPDLVVSL
jgi:predicted phosphohydrolase